MFSRGISSLLRSAHFSRVSTGRNLRMSTPLGIVCILLDSTPSAASSAATSDDIATKASACRKIRLRTARNILNGQDERPKCSSARPSTKKSPDISPRLSALSTHALPKSLLMSTAMTPMTRKPETKTRSYCRRSLTRAGGPVKSRPHFFRCPGPAGGSL